MTKGKEGKTSNTGLNWEVLQQDLKELDRLYMSSNQEDNFEFNIAIKAKKNNLEPEQLRKIFHEYYNEKRKLYYLDLWLGKTPFFSLVQRFSTIIGVITLLISAITFLPSQQQQKRISIEAKNIEENRSHYEAWSIINNNRADKTGNIIKTSSGRISALENLNQDKIALSGLEVPETLLIRIRLPGADLYRANFKGTDLYRATFNSIPKRSNPNTCLLLGWTQLINCKNQDELKARRTDLQRANFRGAILYGTTFNAPNQKPDKTEEDLSNASNQKSDKTEEDLSVNLLRADFRPLILIEKNFEKEKESCRKNTNIRYEQCLENKIIPKLLNIECTMLRNPILQCARVINTEFFGANLKSVDFTKADIKGARFDNSNLECAIFRGATFNKKEINTSIDLPEGIPIPSFKNANIKGADFRDANGITKNQMKEAKNWELAKYSPDIKEKFGLLKDHKFSECNGEVMKPLLGLD